MTKWQKFNFRIFVVLFIMAVVFSYIVNSNLFEKSTKPWHMQPFIDEDVLPESYVEKYEVLGKDPIGLKFYDSTRIMVEILVDAWGVPMDETLLSADFDIFKGVEHQEYLHVRMANRTKHAEKAELHHRDSNSVYLFGGDSLEYGRNEYVHELNFEQSIFCQKCGDDKTFSELDSLLAVGEKKYIAMTTQDARDGNRDALRKTLRQVAEIAKKYPQIYFIVQGTHRPILGKPEIRRQHFAKWVPVVTIH